MSMRFLLIAVAAIFFATLPEQVKACDPFERSFACSGWGSKAKSKRYIKKKKYVVKRKYLSKHKKRYKIVKRSHYKKRTAKRTNKRKSTAKVIKVASSTRALRIGAAHKGRNPTGWRRLWCAKWVNMVEQRAGRRGTGSALAKSFLGYGSRVSRGSVRPGDIAVYNRGRRGGHVGYVVAVKGNKVLLRGGNQCGRSGNRYVCDSWRSKYAAIGYRRPA